VVAGGAPVVGRGSSRAVVARGACFAAGLSGQVLVLAAGARVVRGRCVRAVVAGLARFVRGGARGAVVANGARLVRRRCVRAVVRLSTQATQEVRRGMCEVGGTLNSRRHQIEPLCSARGDAYRWAPETGRPGGVWVVVATRAPVIGGRPVRAVVAGRAGVVGRRSGRAVVALCSTEAAVR